MNHLKNKNINRDHLFNYHQRDKNDSEIEFQDEGCSNFNKLNINSDKSYGHRYLAYIKNNNKKFNVTNRPESSRVRNSPSYLLYLMKSISKSPKRSKTNHEYSIANESSLSIDFSCEEEAENGASLGYQSVKPVQRPKKRISNFKEVSLHSDLNQLDKEFSYDNLNNRHKNINPYTDTKIFDDYLKNKTKQLLSSKTKSSTVEDEAKSGSHETNAEAVAVEFLLNTCKNVIILLVILFIVWPLNIFFKFIWLLSNYLCYLFPNLEDSSVFVQHLNKKLTYCEEKLLDNITFLN